MKAQMTLTHTLTYQGKEGIQSLAYTWISQEEEGMKEQWLSRYTWTYPGKEGRIVLPEEERLFE
jgi:hypothetical protein